MRWRAVNPSRPQLSRVAPALAAAPFVVAGLAAWALAWNADRRWYEWHVLLHCFVKTPAVLWWGRHLRAISSGLGLVSLCGLAPLAYRGCKQKNVGAVIGSALRIGLAVLLALATCEIMLRRHEARRLAEQQRSARPPISAVWDRLCEPHPRYGWRLRPSQTYTGFFGERITPFSVNAEANRAERDTSVPDPARPTVLFAGESVTAGQGLLYGETFPALVGEQLGVQAVNLGVLGYGSDQAYLRLVDTLPAFEHPVAVVTLFVHLNLGRNFSPGRPHLELDDSAGLRLVPPAPPGRVPLRLEHVLFDDLPYRSISFTHRSVALLRAIFRDTAEKARARGAYPLFVVPRYVVAGAGADSPDEWLLHQLFDEPRLPYVVVDLDPAQTIPGDGHPNAEAAALIATRIVAALRAAGIGSASADGPPRK